jgi:putative spermidine/putrescine transport system permease protein
MTESPLVRAMLRIGTWVVLGFLYLPLVILAVYAFNPSRALAWPPPGLTLHWFADAASNPAVRAAFLNSIIAGSAATAIALVLGTLASLVLPIALPGVITGIALQTTFKTMGLSFGLMTIVIGHATFCVVIAYNNVVARLRRLPRTPEEASADLGADSWLTFRRITLPGLATALLSGALLSFALSFDEVIVTLFTAGAGTQTIPIWIFASIQRPTELPVVNVVALVLLLLSVIPVYLAQRIAGETAGLTR